MRHEIKFETHISLLNKGMQPSEDVLRVTIRTINPDQTGLMTHSEIKRSDLPVFWLGVNAVAKAWEPNGLPVSDT